MDRTFILNKAIRAPIVHNAIYERISKAKAITSLLLASDSLVQATIYDLVWAIDSYLEELSSLQERLTILED